MRNGKERLKKFVLKVCLAVSVLLLGAIAYFYFHRMPYALPVDVTQYARLTNIREDKIYRDLNSPEFQAVPLGVRVEIKQYHLVKTAEEAHSQVYAQIEMDGEQFYINAENLELEVSNAINQEVEKLGYPEFEIKQDVQGIFPKWSYMGDRPSGVLVHDTGNDGSILDNEVRYMVRNFNSSGIFVHSFIDSQEIRTIASEEFMAQGAGGQANPRFIQFELLRESSKEKFVEQTARAAYYTAYMLRSYDLPLSIGREDGSGTLWTHEMVSSYLGGTNHVDPRDYWASMADRNFQTTYGIENFKELVQVYYNKLKL